MNRPNSKGVRSRVGVTRIAPLCTSSFVSAVTASKGVDGGLT